MNQIFKEKEKYKMKINKKVQLITILLVGFLIIVGIENAKADVPLNAKSFVMDGKYSSDQWITETDTEGIWYKIDIPSDGIIELRIMSYCEDSLYFSLKSEDLSEEYKFTSCDDYVPHGDGASPSTATASKILSKGVYYLNLSGTVGRYRIMGSFTSYGINDTGADSYDSPYNYTLGKNVTGALTETDAEDWYKIKIRKSGTYNFKIKSYADSRNYYQLSSYDLATKIVDEYVSGGNPTEPATKIEKVVLKPGTYYLKISGDKGKYIFSISQEKILKNIGLKITAKKGKKTVLIKTVKNAKVTLRFKGKSEIKYSNSSGKVKFKFKKKMKKGNKIKVTVVKNGYKRKLKQLK